MSHATHSMVHNWLLLDLSRHELSTEENLALLHVLFGLLSSELHIDVVVLVFQVNLRFSGLVAVADGHKGQQLRDLLDSVIIIQLTVFHSRNVEGERRFLHISRHYRVVDERVAHYTDRECHH